MPNCKSFLVTETETKHVRRRARFQQHRDASYHQVLVFPARQGSKGNPRHSDRNIRGTCTIVCHRQKLGSPAWTWWFFHLWCASSWTNQNSANSRWNSRANLGRPPHFGGLHSWRFGHAEALQEVAPETPERGSKTSTMPVVWATFGIFSARSKWFPVWRDWWLWTKPGYITMTRRQSSNQRSSYIASHTTPKNLECKNPLEKFSPRFSGIKTVSFSLIIFQRA